ncbi:hypothetical protein D3C81_1998250 [compost metagenome]
MAGVSSCTQYCIQVQGAFKPVSLFSESSQQSIEPLRPNLSSTAVENGMNTGSTSP